MESKIFARYCLISSGVSLSISSSSMPSLAFIALISRTIKRRKHQEANLTLVVSVRDIYGFPNNFSIVFIVHVPVPVKYSFSFMSLTWGISPVFSLIKGWTICPYEGMNEIGGLMENVQSKVEKRTIRPSLPLELEDRRLFFLDNL